MKIVTLINQEETMNCQACSLENCTNQRCKDILDREEKEIVLPPIEEIIDQLWG